MDAIEQLTVVDDALYGQLLAVRVPRAITSDAKDDRLATELESIDSDDNATNEVRAYGELIGALLAAYDREKPPFGEDARAADVLALLLEDRGLKPVDPAPVAGGRAYVSQLLSVKRGISREMAKKLATFFQVEQLLFVD